MKKVFIAVLVVLFMALTTTVFAFGPGMKFADKGRGWCGSGKRIAADLNLTKEQTETLVKIREKQQADTQALRNDMFQKRFELGKLFVDPSADDAAITAKQREIDVLRQKMQDKMVQFKLEQRKVFTTEQLTKMNTALQQFQDRVNSNPNTGKRFGGKGFFHGGYGKM